MEAFETLIIGVQIVVSIQYSQFSGVFKRVLHITECIEYTTQSPDVNSMIYFSVVPCV